MEKVKDYHSLNFNLRYIYHFNLQLEFWEFYIKHFLSGCYGIKFITNTIVSLIEQDI